MLHFLAPSLWRAIPLRRRTQANRVVFVVDGFNLYHSLRDVARPTCQSTRWLDLHALCDSYLYLVGNGAHTEAIHYFTALANHRESSSPGTVLRHKDYIAALQDTGVTVSIANFKRKTDFRRLRDCDVRLGRKGKWRHLTWLPFDIQFTRYEEKETDVAIAVKLVEVVVTNACDTAVVVSGDTDIIPAIKTRAI